jgi:hypothetical protein
VKWQVEGVVRTNDDGGKWMDETIASLVRSSPFWFSQILEITKQKHMHTT